MPSLRSLDKEYWSNKMQETLFVENTAVFLADTEAGRVLASDGRKFHKPIISKPSTGTYTPYQDITINQMDSSDQELEVDTFDYAAVEVDDTDIKQNFYDAASFAAMSMQKQLNNRIEQKFLSEVTNAGHVLDAASLGIGTGAINFDTSLASRLFTAGHTKLDVVDAPMTNRVAVLGAHSIGVLREAKAGRETGLGDTVLANGIVGNWQGWTVVQNNNLPYSASFELATNPTAGDWVEVAGVRFTFRAVPALPGEVDIGADAAASRILLANAINGSATGKNSATGYFEVSTEDRFILSEKRRIVAADNIAGTQVDITGFGDIVVNRSMTAAGNAWHSQTQQSILMVRGAIDLAVQMPTDVEIVRKEKGFAEIVKALAGYGTKTFDDGKRLLIRSPFSAANWA